MWIAKHTKKGVLESSTSYGGKKEQLEWLDTVAGQTSLSWTPVNIPWMLDSKGNNVLLENIIPKLDLFLSSLSPGHLSANPEELHVFIRHQVKGWEFRVRHS